jgi:feruloyl esterase
MGMGATKPEVYRTRPVCAYPNQARYKGRGDIDDAANFECVDVKR